MSYLGPECYQSNRYIRKLLALAGASQSDVFYDLGCGLGQLCVLAVTEFNVKKAVGFERHKGRAKKAEERIKALGLGERIQIKNEDFWDSDIGKATIVYHGLTERDEDVADFERKLAPGCKVLTLFLPFVGVVPTDADYPFYLMQLPFTKTKSASRWITAVLFKKATLKELCQELDSDKEYTYDKVIFKRLIKKRLPNE